MEDACDILLFRLSMDNHLYNLVRLTIHIFRGNFPQHSACAPIFTVIFIRGQSSKNWKYHFSSRNCTFIISVTFNLKHQSETQFHNKIFFFYYLHMNKTLYKVII